MQSQTQQPRSGLQEDGAGTIAAFVHIPKTAGGTVRNMLARAYGRSGLHNAGNFLRDSEKTARKLTRRPGGWERWHGGGGRVTAGHVPFGLFREHLPGHTSYMTFLREPVQQVVSLYYGHIHRTGSAKDREGLALTDSLEEALEMRLPLLSNLATRFLCGEPSPMAELSADALDEAKANLRRFAVVGIQERFDESVVLLQRTRGLPLVPYTSQNVGRDRPTIEEISGEQRALIADQNRLDEELYALALELFEDAVAAAGDGFASDVETLRAVNTAANEERRHSSGWRA